mgnify:CR=1 FL=1
MERIQLRRDSALGWSTNNPILASGEIGIELSPTPAKIVLFKVGTVSLHGIACRTRMKHPQAQL